MDVLPKDLENAFDEWDNTEDTLKCVRHEYQQAAANHDRRELFFQAFKLGGAVSEHYQAMRKAMDLTLDWVSKGVTNADN